MNKAYNLHVYCKNSDVVIKYLDVLDIAISEQKDKAIECIEDNLYGSAESYLENVKVLEALHEKLQESYNEIKALGLEVEDNGQEDEPEATNNELL